MKEACDRVIAATTPAPEAPAAPAGKAAEKGKTVKARGAPGPAVKCP